MKAKPLLMLPNTVDTGIPSAGIDQATWLLNGAITFLTG
jgi:hypothetical protein